MISRLAIILLTASLGACSSTDPEHPRVERALTPIQLVNNHRDYILPGERIQYDVQYLFLKMGEIVIKIHPTRDDLLRITSATSPTRLAAALSRYGGFATTWLDVDRMLPSRYIWNSLDKKRRYNEFQHERGVATGLQIHEDEWDVARFQIGVVQDPVSVLMLLRVIELPVGGRFTCDLVEGYRHRLCTIRRFADEALDTGDGIGIPCRRFTLRVDRLEDGALTNRPPEMNLTSWLSLDDRRVGLRTQGEIQGREIRILLTRYDPPPGSPNPH